jgi:hypothetical protein
MLKVVDAEGYRGKKAHFVCDHIPRFTRRHRASKDRGMPIAEQFTTTLWGRYRLLPTVAALAS